MLLELLAEAGMEVGDLERIAVTTGPGSFTGVRIGLSTAMGLGLGGGIPVVGIDSFTAFAASLPAHQTAIVIESRRAELYWRLAGSDSTPGCDLPAQIARAMPSHVTMLGGDAALHLAPLLPDLAILPQLPGPDTAAMARLATCLTVAPGFPGPTYVRPPDAKLPGSQLP